MSIKERFEIEIGKFRTMAEIRAAWTEVEAKANILTKRHDELCKMECTCTKGYCLFEKGSSCERAKLLSEFNDQFPDSVDWKIARDALFEIMPDFEELEELRPGIEATPEPRRSQALAVLENCRKELATGHIRNTRAWIGLFGSDSEIRIEVFSWIAGIEPNYEELEDATQEEEQMFKEQMEKALSPIKEALDRSKTVN